MKIWLSAERFLVACACLSGAVVGLGCQGGALTYERTEAAAPSAEPGEPYVVTLPVAPEGYHTTPDDHAAWEEKQATGEDFNELMVLPQVVTATPGITETAHVEDDRLSVPLAGNEALLEMKPGTPLIGRAADVHKRRAGQSNNVLGFMRKVKTVTVQDGQVVVETEQAHLEDLVVGSAAFSFPKTFEPVDIADEVDIRAILPDLVTAGPRTGGRRASIAAAPSAASAPRAGRARRTRTASRAPSACSWTTSRTWRATGCASTRPAAGSSTPPATARRAT